MTPQREAAYLAPEHECANCPHALRMHDTGWDAAGCMAGDCNCRSFKPKALAEAAEAEKEQG